MSRSKKISLLALAALLSWRALPPGGGRLSVFRRGKPAAAAPAISGGAAVEADLRDAAASPGEGEPAEDFPFAVGTSGLDPLALDLPANGNSWWAFQAEKGKEATVAVYQGAAPGEIRKVEPGTAARPRAPGTAAAPSIAKKSGGAPIQDEAAARRSPPALLPSPPAGKPLIVKNRMADAAEVRGAPSPAAARRSRPGADAPYAPSRPRSLERRYALKPAPPRKFRPILLSRLLGKGAIRPPKGNIRPPDFKTLAARIPARAQDGSLIDPAPPAPSQVEALRPPELNDDKKGGVSHWHGQARTRYFHEGPAWGRWDGKNWSWLQKSEGRWFLEAREKKEGEGAALLWHESHWWWKANGVWFLLHDGEAWGYRIFAELRSEGLVNPRTGAQMVYSADGDKVAVITPGSGAALFDAESGRELHRWAEDEMPKKAKPKVPSALSFHAD